MIQTVKNIYKTKTLKKRLYVFFTLLAFPSLLALISYQYFIVRSNAIKATENKFFNIAENALINFNLWKDTNEKRLKILSLEAKEYISNNAKNRKELENALKLFTSVYGDAYIAHVLNPKGFQIARSDSEKPLTDYHDREYFIEAMEGKHSEQTVISKTYSKPALCSSLPITEKKKIVAVVSTCVFLKDLRERIAHDYIGKTGEYLLINDKNQVISESAEKLDDASNTTAVRALRAGKTGSFLYSENNIDWYSYIQPLSNNWAIIIKQQRNEITTAANEHLQKAFFFTLIIFIVASAMLLQAFNYFLKPIFDLTNSIRAQKDKPEQIKLPRPEEEELALLTDAFNAVASSLQNSIQHVHEKKEQLKNYQSKLELKINEQSKLLSSKEKTANLGVVAGNIAHEIKNPLATISASNQLIKTLIESKTLFDVKKILSHIDKIDLTIERISKIIRGIQSIARNAENDPMEETSFKNVIEEIQEIYKPHFLSKNIPFHIENIPDITIYCRGVQISQVIVNLLNNAADAIEPLEEKWIRINFQESEHVLRITITDSGKGIPNEIADNLMQNYFTTKEAHKGTGLGLSISKQLIHAHGGNFYLNRTHTNTQFVIELPIKNINKNQMVA